MSVNNNNVIVSPEIQRWIADALKNENLKKYNIEITGTSEKGDGYIGDITFVNIKGVKNCGEKCCLNLVLKHGKKDENLRKNLPLRIAFEREIYIYSKVIPLFQNFQKKKNLDPIDIIPKCFSTLLYDNEEVLILENLKSIGYDLHDRFKPMEDEFLKLTLEAYGKWHAISFAFRDEKPEEFKRYFSDLESTQLVFCRVEQFKNSFAAIEKKVYSILKENNKPSLIEKLRKRIPDGFFSCLENLLMEKESQSVVSHGDCWNNNFMFKFKDDDIYHENPQKVALLDFQLSFLTSPAIDLSYHLYMVCSEKNLCDFKQLLNIYYKSFSNYLRKLGCDPEKLFPYSDLVKHWKKYSVYGLMMATFVIPFTLAEKDDVLDISEMGEDALVDTMNKTSDKYTSRLLAVIEHNLDFNSF